MLPGLALAETAAAGSDAEARADLRLRLLRHRRCPQAAARPVARYGQHSVAEAEVVVALGGDGFLLQTLRETMGTGKRVYGMNRGTVGFLMNEYRDGRPAASASLPRSPRRSGRWRCRP